MKESLPRTNRVAAEATAQSLRVTSADYFLLSLYKEGCER